MLLLAMQSAVVSAQIDTSGLWVNVDSIQITATRISKTWLRSSRAVSDIQLPVTKFLPDLTLQDRLTHIPGVFSLNAQNMAQDLRISIRGFGTRSAFGVRGIKLIIDGIPETTTDGQGQLDAIPLALISNLEVIRGPASLLYGNASGGVISMKTLGPSNSNLLARPLVLAKLAYGSFNTLQAQATYAAQLSNTSILGHGSYSRSDGFRAHSGYSQAQFKLRGDHRFSKYSKLTASVDYLTSPRAQDPGGLDLARSDSIRSLARPDNVDFDAGEEVQQLKGSVAYSYKVSPTNTFDTYAFYVNRGFDGRLPFGTSGVIALDRDYFGQGASYTVVRNKNNLKQTIKWGYDVSSQLDSRQRFDVLLGVPGRLLSTNQEEIFKNVGVYVISDFNLGAFSFNMGWRFDHNNIKLVDNFTDTGERSFSEDFTAFNPSIGINYELPSSAALFGSFSTAFETPTLNEVGNNVLAGLPANLRPQRSRNYEVGARMEIEKNLKGQIVLFQTNTLDELLPVALDSFPSPVFENVGTTIRRGLELEVDYRPFPAFRTQAAYSYGQFAFDQHTRTELSGNRLPGLPLHTGTLTTTYEHTSSVTVSLENRYVGDIFLDNENKVGEPAYLLGHLTVSYTYKNEHLRASPFLNVRNLYNTIYHDNLRINAFGARYYEPAPGLHFFAGINIKL